MLSARKISTMSSEVLNLSRKLLCTFGTSPASIAFRRSTGITNGIKKFTFPPNHEIYSDFNRIMVCSIKPFSTKSDATTSDAGEASSLIDDEFQPLDVIRSRSFRRTQRKRREKREVPPPRYLKMSTDQDWPSVWPTAKTFHPASVPLPLHQGYVEPGNRSPPNKFANLELMKIPNFLHLTPPAIKRHCEAIKKFCTPWPEELKDEYVLESLFPIEVISNDYCHSSPSIRDPKGRIVTLRVKLSHLNLDEHAKDKFLRLVGERYDQNTDELTLVTDCCPLKKQNYDYAMYLLTAVYHESWNKESWEDDKSELDAAKYEWDGSRSQKVLEQLLEPTALESNKNLIEQYKNTVTSIHDEGENTKLLSEYGNTVRQLLNLPTPEASSATSS
ncbi:unnamed protein product [Orchesella dallaii]|uniref:Small ribosomal subunit protein mS35 mitochondrial conserved domain-containing protein n=1 Tax=Orchesella dallaii TaxID=48710 RepID=A0ABP1PR36_9HEXA